MVTNSTYQTGPGDQAALPKRKAGSKLTSGHLIMILSGLAAFLLIIVVLGSQGKKITVYTARDSIYAGQKISTGDFEAKEIPSSSLDEQYFSSEDFKGDSVFASRLISKNEPLLKQDSTPKSESSALRLLSIPLAKKYAVDGTLAKGDKVDVFETSADDGCVVRMLTGINIVAVSSGSSGGLGGGDSTYAVIVSLENDVDDAVLAGVIGRGNNIQLARTTGIDSENSNTGPECFGARIAD